MSQRGTDWLWEGPNPDALTEEEDELEADIPSLPTIDAIPTNVDYSTRGPDDWVVSGPLNPSGGNGRYFNSELAAFRFCCEKYGRSRVSPIAAGSNRWAFLIKKV